MPHLFSRPCRRLAAWLCAALTLAACGSGDDPAPETAEASAVAAGQRAQGSVGAGGGTVELTTREGARLTLTVPAGAVPDGTVLGLETAQAAAGRRLHLRLAPAGLLPAQPLLLTMALPASMALPTGATLAYDRVPVPVTRLADGRLQLRLSALATGGAAAAQAGRARALSARALADAPANPCAGAPALDSAPDGGLADTAPIDADVYGNCMLGAVNALAQSGEFAEAVRLASSIGAYLQSIGAANTDGLSTRFLTEANRLACTAYGLALDTATNTPITAFDTPTRLAKPVLFWEATIQRLGTTCPGIAPARYVEVVEQLTGRGLAYFAGRQGQVVDVASTEYTAAVGAVRAAPQAVAQVRSLQAPPAVQALAQAQLQQRAQPAIVDAVLQAPWQRCSDSGRYDKLVELMVEGGSPEAVKTAAQYCGTLLQVQARAANGSVLATLTPSLGGVAAGNQRTSGSIEVAADGILVLDGPIRALQCPAGSTGGSESLELRLDNALLQTLTAAPYLATSLSIDMAAALRAAGINANSFTGGTLTIHRTGSPCGGLWGNHPEPLLTVSLVGAANELVFQAKAYTRYSGIYPTEFTGGCAAAPIRVQFPDGDFFYRITITHPRNGAPGKARLTLVQSGYATPPFTREKIEMSTVAAEVFSPLPDGSPMADGVYPNTWSTSPAVSYTLAQQPQFQFAPATPGSRNGVLTFEHAFDEPSGVGTYRYLSQLVVTVQGNTASVVYSLRTLLSGGQNGCNAQWRSFDAQRVN